MLSARSKALRIPGSKKLLGLFGLAVSSVGAHVLMDSIDGSRLRALYYRAGKSCDKVSLFNDKVYLCLTLSHRSRSSYLRDGSAGYCPGNIDVRAA